MSQKLHQEYRVVLAPEPKFLVGNGICHSFEEDFLTVKGEERVESHV